jgi:hypothetical protein
VQQPCIHVPGLMTPATIKLLLESTDGDGIHKEQRNTLPVAENRRGRCRRSCTCSFGSGADRTARIMYCERLQCQDLSWHAGRRAPTTELGGVRSPVTSGRARAGEVAVASPGDNF